MTGRATTVSLVVGALLISTAVDPGANARSDFGSSDGDARGNPSIRGAPRLLPRVNSTTTKEALGARARLCPRYDNTSGAERDRELARSATARDDPFYRGRDGRRTKSSSCFTERGVDRSTVRYDGSTGPDGADLSIDASIASGGAIIEDPRRGGCLLYTSPSPRDRG